MRLAILLVAALVLTPRLAVADDGTAPSAEPPANKLTVAYYGFSSGVSGADINLRHTFSTSTAWVGAYHQGNGFDQTRLGYEFDYHHRWLTIVPSAQNASHGFFGATLYSEAGQHLFAIGGAGRTNLQPYWNLGFDPNDFVQFGAGYHDHDGSNTVSVYAIRDVRLGTGQTNTHFFFRRHTGRDWRWTVDTVREHGIGNDGTLIRSWAVSVDADWRRWFVRVADDQHVNYTADRQLRIISGVRF